MTRKFIRKREQPRVPPRTLLKAVKLHFNQGYSIRKAAVRKKIPFETLRRCINRLTKTGEVSFGPYDHHRKVFSTQHEQELCKYLILCSKMCFGVSTVECRKLAYQLAVRNSFRYPKSWDKHEMAELDWLSAFRARNPELSIRKPENCSFNRAVSFNKTNVSKFYDNLEVILARDIRLNNPCRIFNLDETGTTTVPEGSAKVLAEKNVKQISRIVSAERGTLVTTCCFVNAAGESLPPAMVFPRVKFLPKMTNNAVPNTLGLAEKSGWMTKENFVKVMAHFIKYSNSSKDNPCLLIYDNHESHLSLDVLDLAKNNGVIIITLPPHTSDKMQPLDLSLFGPFKRYYERALVVMMARLKCPLTIYEVAECVRDAYEASFTGSNIRAGFAKAGIWPFNKNIFPDSAFISGKFYDRAQPENVPKNNVNDINLPKEGVNASNSIDVNPQPSTSGVIKKTAKQPPISDVTDKTGKQPSTSDITEKIVEQPSTSGVTVNVTVNVQQRSTPNLKSHNTTTATVDLTPCPKIDSMHPIAASSFPTASPKEISPFPQAKPRDPNKKKRRTGSSIIATDTPQKKILEDLEKERQEKREQAKMRLERKQNGEKETVTGRKVLFPPTPQKKKKSDKSAKPIETEEIINILEDVPKPDLVHFIVDKATVLKNGDFVLVFFKDKKCVYYVGQIEKCYPDTDLEVRFMRLNTKNNKFYFPQVPEIATVNRESVKFFLPPPIEKENATKRQKSYVEFNVDMDRLTVR